jgi:RNA polymerase sigma-70 factor, ECF subfamily
MSERTDLQLVEAFRQGETEGFNELVRRYQQRIYWVARRIVGSHAEADDAVQEVFVRVYEGLKGFRAESGFYTWLYRITMNVSLNALRRKKVKEFVRFDEFQSEAVAEEKSDEPLLVGETRAIIQRAIDSLPSKQKAVFVLRYYEELTYEEIAVSLKTSVGGLKANYFHALNKIKSFVRKEMGT